MYNFYEGCKCGNNISGYRQRENPCAVNCSCETQFSCSSPYSQKKESKGSEIPKFSNAIYSEIKSQYNDTSLSVYNPNIDLEDKCMSIIHGAVCKDGVVLVSDSRSSKKVNGIWEFNDSYVKQYYFSDINLGVISAGLNEFGDDKFIDLCTKAETMYDSNFVSKNESVEKIINQLGNSLQYYANTTGYNCQVIYGFMSSQMLFGKTIKTPKIISTEYAPLKNPIVNQSIQTQASVTFGVSWMQNYLVNRKNQEVLTADEYAVEAKDMLEDMIRFSNRYDKPSFVGGKVNTLVIK